MKRKLKDTAVPTIDVAGVPAPSTEELSDRKRRQVLECIKCINLNQPHCDLVSRKPFKRFVPNLKEVLSKRLFLMHIKIGHLPCLFTIAQHIGQANPNCFALFAQPDANSQKRPKLELLFLL